jgi:hypothetical protein
MRPKTGMIGRYDLANGKGKLKVENGSDQDGIVILSDKSDNAKLAGYIRAGSNFTIGGIPDGSYRVFFATGDCWDDETRSFATNVRAVRMFELENYKTTSSTYTIWEITLHNVEGGEGIGAEVPDNELPVIP